MASVKHAPIMAKTIQSVTEEKRTSVRSHEREVVDALDLPNVLPMKRGVIQVGLLQCIITVPRHGDHRIMNANPVCFDVSVTGLKVYSQFTGPR